VLRASRIVGRSLRYRGAVLTSERLKFAIESACLEAGANSSHTIAAGGDQACDPHDSGSGPLRPHELIVVDIFPRVQATGYHGDMTRTFLRGQASEAQQALVAAVRAAQKAALRTIRAGVEGRAVHAAAVSRFAALGYETKRIRGRSVGFFHGTGHGLGLEIHEPPRLGATAEGVLPRGAVVTVEPGLYYPGLGGCRIEDVVQVTSAAPKLLSRFHYQWQL
jgi:Xaa-Pro aminopeptidase